MGLPVQTPQEMDAALATLLPERERLLAAAGGARLYLVGGAVRDLLLGRPRADVDIAVEGNVADIAARLGGEAVEHERFATAKTRLDRVEVDLARARTETYREPGALPDVRPATIGEDLARRDFTINAMALPLEGEARLIDPHGGREDLEAGRLRVLHERSFADDPTRALRAARYAARFGFALETRTADLLRAADLATVSADRTRAELRRIAREPAAAAGFSLLAEWRLLPLREDGAALAARAADLLAAPPWSEVAERERTLLAAAIGPEGRERELAAADPRRPSEAVELARGATPEELVLGRALGGRWLDRYVSDWRSVALEVRGSDLIAAGVPEGPAVGRGLAAALRRKLDGEVSGREEELAAALEAARGP